MKVPVSVLAGGMMALTAAAVHAQTKWDMPTAYPPGNFHTENVERFAEDVRAATNGELDIVVHPGGSLFKSPEIKRAVQTQQAQIGELLMSNLSNEAPIFGVDSAPFLATSFEEAGKLWAASRPIVERRLDEQGLTLLYAVPWPPQGIFVNKPLESVEDMRGLKFRAYNPATARFAELVGAQPVTIQAAELSQALAQGVANSMITSPATGYDSKVWEQLSHFYDVQAWLPKNMVFVNKAAFEALPEDQRQAVLAAAQEAERRGWEKAREQTDWYKSQLQAEGMAVTEPNPDLRAQFQEIGRTMTEEWLGEAGEEGREAVDAYRAM